MSINSCRLISFPKITDSRGSLTFIESQNTIPFQIKRIYYIYDVPKGQQRAGHAHKQIKQVLIAISGSFEVIINHNNHEYIYKLESPDCGLYIPSLCWININNFSSGAVCLVLASDVYDELEYYRHYEDFLKAVKQ